LLYFQQRRKFYGQLFLMYLGMYAFGRIIIEIFRGDEIRGYVFDIISHSQLIAVCIIVVVVGVHWRWSAQNRISKIRERT
jgi:phosphatidylglycerol---prolipoprotein diacylglyceryl transferase